MTEKFEGNAAQERKVLTEGEDLAFGLALAYQFFDLAGRSRLDSRKINGWQVNVQDAADGMLGWFAALKDTDYIPTAAEAAGGMFARAVAANISDKGVQATAPNRLLAGPAYVAGQRLLDALIWEGIALPEISPDGSYENEEL